MANLSDEELRRMGKEQLKEAFEKIFSTKLTHVLEFDPNTFVKVEMARKILQAVNRVAITYGKNYVAEDRYLWVFTKHCLLGALVLRGLRCQWDSRDVLCSY